MAFALAPLVIPATEAILVDMVYIGSALMVGIGIVKVKDEIDRNFSATAPSATKTCPCAAKAESTTKTETATQNPKNDDDQSEKCNKSRHAILDKFSIIGKELRKYDPVADAKGGFKHKYGVTKPCGHYREIRELQKGLKNDLKQFQENCQNSGVKIDRSVDQMANRPIERPVGCEEI
ncbi:MAG: hypothetical protein WCO00_07615 [Rhodospirillaceae bacterium]